MQKISVKGSGLSAMCRLCLSKDLTLLDIFYFSAKLKNHLSNIVMWCAPVQIRRCDEMPNFICRLCYTQLENIHQFQKQIVQSDKTLRRYLQQLGSDKQIKSECSIQKSSEEHLIHKTNHCDVTVKCESIVFQDIFGMNLNRKEMAPKIYNAANKINEETLLKFEIKDEPTYDNSVDITECVADTVETSSNGDGSEIPCEDSKVDISDTKFLAENIDIFRQEKHFLPANISQEMPLKLEIKNEPTNDNSLNQTECTADTVETSSKGDGSEICSENSKVDSGHISENNVAELLDKNDKRKNNVSINYGKHKKATGKNYYCNICNETFTKYFTFKTHIRIHIGVLPYQCDICNECFSQLNNFISHKRTHAGVKSLHCDICNKGFSNSSNLKCHKRTHTGEKPYQCDVCNKCFGTLNNLSYHKRTHTGEKPYQCDVCNKCFSAPSSLSNHKRMHTGEKPYQCAVCNKCFCQLSSLISHKRTHTGEKPYQCDVCKKCFRLSWHLIEHKRIHTGEKPYQCDVCKKCFRISWSLIEHKRIHTGEKPYQCDVCNKYFSQSRNLNTHILKRNHTY